MGGAGLSYASPLRDLCERAVPSVVIQPVGLALAAEEKIEEAVVIVVRPGGADGVDGLEQAGLARHVGERAIAVLPHERRAHRVFHPSAAETANAPVHVVLQ